jgi:hypothetical protein
MPERNDPPTLAEEEADFLDDDLDLDELGEVELPDAGPGEPELIDDAAADALLAEELEPVEMANGKADLSLLEPALDELPDADVLDTLPSDDADLGDELEPSFDDAALTMPATATATDIEARLAKLEAAARALATAEVTRDRKKVRRKVSAATTGAGVIGAVPILLQLAGAFNLDPEIVATASTVAAAIGAFIAGWLTPERKPTIPTEVALETLTRRR